MITRIIAKIREILKHRWCIYSVKESDCVYLTFDDGPEPEITEFVLDALSKYDVKATFFCVGNNIEINRSLYDRIINEGHAIGSHTMSHLKGSETSNSAYLTEVYTFRDKYGVNLLRPPFGQLSLWQLIRVHLKGFKVILWSKDSKDWESEDYTDSIVNDFLSSVTAGDIILMHFCKKHAKKTMFILPKLLEELKIRGIQCKTI